jgi:hypothetical protein
MLLDFSRREFLLGSAALAAAGFPRGAAAISTRKRLRGLVVLIEFPDLRPPFRPPYAVDRFQKLSHYVSQMSYGTVGVDFDFTDWVRMPEPISSYKISPANLKVDKSRVTRLIQDAIDGADSQRDFSDYDYLAIFMGARFTDYGMVGLCGYPGMLGWRQEIIFKTSGRGQVVPNGVAIFTASAHLGTLFHDSAHVWGGVVDGKRRVPCLYDHDLQEQYPTRDRGFARAMINMGFWDPMSCHFYDFRTPPPGTSSWTKLRLGWLAPEKVRTVDPDSPGETLLGPLEGGSSGTLAIRIPLSPTRYILIENRQPIGLFDSTLPKHGVLIMHADDGVAECRYGRAPVKLVNANPDEEFLIGAAFDLPQNSNYIDPENKIEVRLLEKVGKSYRIAVRRPR